MPFPRSTRVIYRRNPLNEVICQVKFPPILRIEGTAPAEFQDRIRKEFPLYSEVQPESLPPNMPAEFANMARAMMPARLRAIAHQFSSEDENWSMTLGRDSLGFKTRKYTRWETFRELLELPIRSLIDLYKPTFFARVGLRYINVIQRSKLGLVGQPWSTLLKTHIAGELAAPELQGLVEGAGRELRVRLAPERFVTLRHGLAEMEDSAEECFVIDSDFFTERRVEPTNAGAILNEFNSESGHLFRWCIEDALHAAMEPDPAN